MVLPALFNTAAERKREGDILIIYNHNKHIEEQIAQELKTIHKNIEFIHETETNNNINYLDLSLKKNFGTNSIEVEKYRKPSSNKIAMHRNSRHPHQQKNELSRDA